MKLSELIKHLQHALKEHGDLPCHVYEYNSEEVVDLAGFAFCEGDDGKPESLLFVDADTLDAFL